MHNDIYWYQDYLIIVFVIVNNFILTQPVDTSNSNDTNTKTTTTTTANNNNNNNNNCVIAVGADMSKFREPLSGKRPRILQRRRENNIDARGRRHYVIDYFVVIDYAIYNRWDIFITY